jgi:uncharacterized protein YqgC (DUF456 family)
MHLVLILPMLAVLAAELIAFVKVVQKFRSPWAAAVALVGLFVVNILIYAAIIELWITQTPT